ncbi:hypothetical protein [Vibrio diazotrophicus]|uniref:hypothetical protein n=1 Tax=Vibrio diazotrophicus TaxID=685 RepID=UPI000C9DD0E6|nr:hypothetical protein [Vibrio diazotrophicus]PNH81349.1 hypothetical protein C1N27_07335 [Vibrio diazotrophicus]
MLYNPQHYVTACLTYCYTNDRLQHLLKFIAMIESGCEYKELVRYGLETGYSVRTIDHYYKKYNQAIKEMKANKYKEIQ